MYNVYSQGRIQEFVQEGGLIFFLSRGAQHTLGPENPLKSIEFTGPGGGLSRHSPPLIEYASVYRFEYFLKFQETTTWDPEDTTYWFNHDTSDSGQTWNYAGSKILINPDGFS